MNARMAFVLVASLIVLPACENKLADLSNTELQDKMWECQQVQNPAPGFAISCDKLSS